MPNLDELTVEALDRLTEESVGRVELTERQLADQTGAMASVNTCYRSCGHTICFC